MKKLFISAIAAILLLTACEEGMTYKSHNSSYYPYLEFQLRYDNTYDVTIVDEVENVVVPTTFNGLPVHFVGAVSSSVKSLEKIDAIRNSVRSLSIGTPYVDFSYFNDLSEFKNVSNITFLDNVTRTNIGNTFYWNPIKSFSTGNSLSYIEGALFWNSTSLEEVVIGNGVKTVRMKAFDSCTSLRDVKFGNSLETIEVEAFKACTSLTSIELPESLKTLGALAFLGCTGLKHVEIPDSVTEIGLFAFGGCYNLESVSLPPGTYNLENIFNKGPDWSVNGEKIEDVTNFVATDRKLIERNLP